MKMKKFTRFTALLLALVLTCSTLLVPAQASSFEDVKDTAWYAEAVENANAKGWMLGTGENTFAPGDAVTRAMFVTVLARFAGVDTEGLKSDFVDVPNGKWFSGPVAWAAEKGIVNGVGKGFFAPNRPISRQDLCTILARFFTAQGIDLELDGNRSFADQKKISSYAKDAVALCASAGLVAGYEDGTFRPADTASRAQVAVILTRLDALLKGEEVNPEPMPAQSFEGSTENLGVAVEAPEGALPADTAMQVRDVAPAEQEAIRGVQTQSADQPAHLLSLDITFMKDGAEVEPERPVQVTLTNLHLEAGRIYTIRHYRKDNTVEEVARIRSDELADLTSLTFTAGSFSVYEIVDSDDESQENTYSIKYEFYTDDTFAAPYKFIDASGNETWFQYVGNGEYLYSPGKPAGYDNLAFTGWFAANAEEAEIPSGVDKVQKTVTASSTVKLYPRFEEPFFIEYRDEDFLINTTESNLFGDFTLNGRTASLEKSAGELRVTYQPNSARNAFLGWAVYDPNKTSYAESDIITQVTFGANENKVSLVPVDMPVVWVQFNKNDDDNDDSSKATYTAPLYLLYGETVAQRYPNKFPDGRNGLPAPTRMGYTFAGWWYETVNNDGEVTAVEFTSSTRVTADMTVNAKWNPSRADYTIVYWAQNASDEVDLPDNEKTYSFLDSTIVTSTTGAMVSLTNNQKNAKLSTGFHLNNAKTTAAEVQVKANNSTVLNVYYDRDIFTLTFQVQGAGYQYVVNNNATSNIYGLTKDGSFKPLRRESETKYYDVYTQTNAPTPGSDWLMVVTNGSQRLVVTNVPQSNPNNPYISQVSITNNPYVSGFYDIELINKGHGAVLDNFHMQIDRRNTAWVGTSYVYTFKNQASNLYLSQSGNTLNYGGSSQEWGLDGNRRLHYDPGVLVIERYIRIAGSGNNQYIELVASAFGTGASFTFYQKTRQSVTSYHYYYTDTGEEYTGDRYVYQYNSSSSTYRNVKQYRALYEHSLAEIFPIQGIDGEDYEGKAWTATDSSVYSYVLKTVDVMPNANVTFRASDNPAYKTILYYIESIPGEAQDPAKEYTTFTAADGVQRTYELYKTVRHNFNFLTYNEEYHPLTGFNRDPGGDPAFGEPYYVYDGGLYTQRNSVRAPIPHYAFGDGYLYYVNDSGRATRLTTAQYGNYKDVWVNKLYYNRESYDVEFLDAITREPIEVNGSPVTLSLAYQQSLKTVNDVFTVSDDKQTLSYNGAELPGHEGYTFSGWYLDPGMTTKADLDTLRMPNGKLRLYAGWTINRYRVWLNPNGGEFGHTDYDDGAHGAGWRFTESTFFRTNYGTLVQRYDDVETIGRKYVQDDANGTYVYVYICDPTDESLDAARAAYYKLESQLGTIRIYNEQGDVSIVNEADFTDGHKYKQQPGVYTFVGWYYATDLDLSDQYQVPVISDTDKLDLFDFNTPIVENMAIRALWKRIGRFRVSYDVDMYKDDGTTVDVAGIAGTGPAASEYDHADLSTVPALRAPSQNPAGYTFLGWKTPSGEIVEPNDLFRVYANLSFPSDDSTESQPKYEYRLTAVYQKLPTTSLTYDANGGEGTLTDLSTTQSFNGITVSGNSVANLLVNAEVRLSSGDGFARPGYALIGWTDAVDENGEPTGTIFELGGTYGIGSDTTLYAVWEHAQFYVFHSATGTLQAFDVPIKFTVDDPETGYGHAEADTFDLTALVADGHLYGGYYEAYGGVKADVVETAIADFKANGVSGSWTAGTLSSDTWTEIAETTLPTTDFTVYDGSSLVTADKKMFWQRANAYRPDMTDKPEGYTDADINGTTMKPQADAVYYLKEVPETYLTTKFIYTWNAAENGDGKIMDFFMITAVDDNLYSDIGFFRQNTGTLNEASTKGQNFISKEKLCTSFSVVQSPSADGTRPEVKVTVTKDNFGLNSAFLAVKQSTDMISENSEFTLMPTWKTLDGVDECSRGTLKLKVDAEKKTINYQLIGGYYIDFSNVTWWNSDDAYTKVYLFSNEGSTWVDPVKVNDTLYTVRVADPKWTGMIVVRVDKTYTGTEYFDGKYNQTVDITLDGSFDQVKILDSKEDHGSNNVETGLRANSNQ